MNILSVPNPMTDNVLFLYGEFKGKKRACGTAFFLGAEIPGSLIGPTWLVTAAHVIDGIRAHSDNGSILARANVQRGGSQYFIAEDDAWVIPDPETDYAFMRWPLANREHQLAMSSWDVDEPSLATPKVMGENLVGLGSEVFMTGLFTRHEGLTRCEPIMRVGNLAAMPVDPVTTGLGQRPAILVEGRSIGGLSGSPVWVRYPELVYQDGRIGLNRSRTNFGLLGLIHGHWDVDSSEIDISVGTATNVNTGIAIVVPIQEILRTFQDEIGRGRQEFEALMASGLLPIPPKETSNTADP